MTQHWPNFSALRHEQAREAEPVATLPEDAPAGAQIPVAEGARFAPPRPDRPQPGQPPIAAGEGIRVTGAEEPVGPGDGSDDAKAAARSKADKK